MEQPRTYTLRLSTGQEFGPADLELLESWAREGRVPRDGLLVALDDPTEVRSVFAEPQLARILQAPPTTRVPFVPSEPTSGLIPYRNPPALTAYYLGIFSLMPLIGVLLAVPAFVLGIVGWRRYLKTPEIRGGVHAWIGIVMGALLTCVWGAALLALLFSAANSGRGGAY